MNKKIVFLPYDFDTALGTNNEGSLVFSYNLEDTDTLSGGANVFNGQDSVLWINMREAFGDDIRSMYQTLRSTGALSYSKVEGMFESHQNKWPEAVFNEDSWFKYLAPLVEDGSGAYLAMLQGSKTEQRKWWLYNRFRYIDSKYNAGDSLTDVIQIRGYAKSNVTVTPYADIYPTVKYGSYLVSQRGARGTQTTLVCPLDTVNDTEIYIYSASQLASVGDLSGFLVGFADFSMATKLQSIKVGSDAVGYANANLTELYVGNNLLLGTVDVRNCTALTGAVDLSGAANVEHVYFEGTAITSCVLPIGGIVKTLHLPDTITNLTVRNQPAITSFAMNDYTSITTLRVENSPAIPVVDIVEDMPANSRVRIIGLDMTVSSTTDVEDFYDILDTMRGIDEAGNNVDHAVVSGTIHGLDSITGEWLAEMQARYPYITIEYQHIAANLKYYNYDGTTLLHTESIVDGGNGTWSGTPARDSTAQYSYTFVGWNRNKNATVNDPNATKSVTADRSIYAAYTATVRTYRVRFYNGSMLLQTVSDVPYGSTATYTGATPTSSQTGYVFSGWSPSNENITGNTDCLAQFVDMSKKIRYYTYDGGTLLYTESVASGGDGVYAGTPSRDPTQQYTYTFVGWNTSMNASVADPNATKNVTADRDVYAAYSSALRVYTVRYYNGQTLLETTTAAYGTDAVYTGATPTSSQTGYVFTGWLPTGENITSDTDCYAQFVDNNNAVTKYISGTLTDYSSDTATLVADYAFYKMSSLVTVETSAKIINSYAFGDCSGLKVVDLTSTDSISIRSKAFNSSASGSRLEKLIIRENTVGTMASDSIYTRSLIGCKLGAIYVKDDLVSEYKSASVWMNYTILPLSSSMASDYSSITDTWEQILEAEDDNTYTEKYSVGDTKLLLLNESEKVYMQIAAFDSDDLSSGGGKAKITWVARNTLISQHNMNDTNTVTQGWSATSMRAYLRETVYPLIPQNIRNGIKEVTKTYSVLITNTSIETRSISDTVWIPSSREVGSVTAYTEGTGPQYLTIFGTNTLNIRSSVTSGVGVSYYTRTPYWENKFSIIKTTGAADTTLPTNGNYIVLCFCT